LEHDLSFIITAINDVNNSIWLGDFKKAVEIANLNLEIVSKLGIPELQRVAIDLRKIIRQIRKDAKEKKTENRRLWVAEQVSKEIEKKELNPIKNIFGVLVIHLFNLRETIGYLMEAKSQATLENFSDKSSEEERFLQETNRYRYAIQRLPDKWEVRAILDKTASLWDLGKLREELSNYGFWMEEISKGRPSRTFELYSQNMYVQVLGQENQVEISIYTPAADAKQRVNKIVETILKILMQ